MNDFTFPPMKEEDRFSYPSDRKYPTELLTLGISMEGEIGISSLAGCLLNCRIFGPIILVFGQMK